MQLKVSLIVQNKTNIMMISYKRCTVWMRLARSVLEDIADSRGLKLLTFKVLYSLYTATQRERIVKCPVFSGSLRSGYIMWASSVTGKTPTKRVVWFLETQDEMESEMPRTIYLCECHLSINMHTRIEAEGFVNLRPALLSVIAMNSRMLWPM